MNSAKQYVLPTIVVLLALATAVFWYLRPDICQRGITYTVGRIDAGFNLTEPELRAALDDAGDVWEEVLGYDVFRFDPDGDLDVFLIFDERQEQTQIEQQERANLTQQEGKVDSDTEEINKLEEQIRSVERQYESLVRTYDTEKSTYDALIARGATTQEIKTQEVKLNSLVPDLNEKQDELNILISRFNTKITSTQGLVDSYNQSADNYNNEFTGTRVFDQGEHTPGRITIYQYDNYDDLVLVLAHEMGHALGIGHVDSDTSVMHAQLENQDIKNIMLSLDDQSALGRVCTF